MTTGMRDSGGTIGGETRPDWKSGLRIAPHNEPPGRSLWFRVNRRFANLEFLATEHSHGVSGIRWIVSSQELCHDAALACVSENRVRREQGQGKRECPVLSDA